MFRIATEPFGSSRFNGDVERALRSITAPSLNMPSAADLCFSVGDAK
jgi:hypothetical protein